MTLTLPKGTALLEFRVLSAIWIAGHQPGELWVDRDQVRDKYHTDLDARMWVSILERLKSRGLIEVYYDGPNPVAQILDHATTKLRIEQAINAETLEVYWSGERVMTDADAPGFEEAIPLPNGWMLMTCDKKTGPSPAASAEHHRDPSDQQSTMMVFGAPALSQRRERPAAPAEGPFTKASTILTGIGVIIGLAALWLAYLALK